MRHNTQKGYPDVSTLLTAFVARTATYVRYIPVYVFYIYRVLSNAPAPAPPLPQLVIQKVEPAVRRNAMLSKGPKMIEMSLL